MATAYTMLDDKLIRDPAVDTTLDTTRYTTLEDTQRYWVGFRAGTQAVYLIAFGYFEDRRDYIVCNSPGELLQALKLVRTAFPAKNSRTKSPRKKK